MLWCAFCRRDLASDQCVWVQLPDGDDFVCCSTACAPMRDAIETHRRGLAVVRRQPPLSMASTR